MKWCWQPVQYHVFPRYTAGCPGTVLGSIATKLIEEERDAYRTLINHPEFLPDESERAQKMGLGRIVLKVQEQGAQVIVLDMITNERWNFPSDMWPTILEDSERLRQHREPRHAHPMVNW